MVVRALLRMMKFQFAIFVAYLVFQSLWIISIGYWFNPQLKNTPFDISSVFSNWWLSGDYVSLIWLGIALFCMILMFINFLRNPMSFSDEKPR